MKSLVEIIDTHCHLDDRPFDEDREAVWKRAQEAGVVAIVNPASTLEDSRAVAKLAHQVTGVFGAIGIHPQAAVEMTDAQLDVVEKEFNQLAKDPLIVAIGEFGLDSKNGDVAKQRPAVQRMLKIATANKLPVILHCRDLYQDLFALLDEHLPDTTSGGHTGVVHSFTGGPAELEQILKRGLHVAFGGIVTFGKRTELLREAVKLCPLDRMLVETDSPYLTPEPRRGKRNEPAEVVTVAQFIASLRGISYAELAKATTQNARRLFSLPDAQETHNNQEDHS